MNNESRTINSVRNIYIGLIYQIISLVMNFLVKTVFIRIFGIDYLGINGFLTNIFTILTFTDLVFGVAMSFSLYKPIVDKDIIKIKGLFNFYKKAYRKATFVIGAIGVLLIPFLPYLINSEINIKNIIVYYLIFLVNIIVYNLYILNTFFIIADQRKYIISTMYIFLDLIGYSLLIVMIIVFKNYLIYVIFYTMITICTALVSRILMKKYYPFVYEGGTIDDNDKNINNKNIKDLMVYRFAMVMVNGTDNIIISMLVSTNQVGIYSNYQMIIMGLDSLVAVVYSAVSASIGNLIAEKDGRSSVELFRWMQVISMWLAGMMSVCLLILFDDFITVWIGEEYLMTKAIEVIIVVNFYLACVRDSMKVFREALGLFTKVKYMMTITAAVNIILSFILGYFFGVIGILGSTTIAAMLTYFWYEAKLIYDEINAKKIWEYFVMQIISILLIILNLFATNSILEMFSFEGVTGFILKLIFCFIICNGIYFLLLFRTKAVRYTAGVFLKKLKK